MDAAALAEKLWKQGYFSRSKRQYRLFEFLLSNSLSDTPRELDQYIIATEVLGRGKDFDSYSDSIVRSEISRLRKALAVYNAEQTDHAYIIPKGNYNIEISSIEAVKPASASNQTATPSPLPSFRRSAWPRVAALALTLIFVAWIITHFSPKTSSDNLRAECSQALPNLGLVFNTESLGENSYIESLVRSSVAQYSNIELVADADACVGDFAPSYAFKVESKTLGDENMIFLELLEKNTNKSIFLERLKTIEKYNIDDDFDISIHAAVSRLLRPYGILPRQAITHQWPDKSYRNSYKCSLDDYDAVRSSLKDDKFNVTQCYEKYYANKKSSPDNLGSLAQNYTIELYGKQASESDEVLLKTQALFNVIGDQWLESSEATAAKILYEPLNPNYTPNALAGIIYTATNHYPENIHVMITATIIQGYTLGEWDKATSLFKRIRKIAQEESSFVFIVDTGHALVNKTPEQALALCKKLFTPNHEAINIVVNACAYHAGDKNLIDRTEAQLTKLGFANIDDRIEFIHRRRYEPKLKNIMINAWSKIDTKLEPKVDKNP